MDLFLLGAGASFGAGATKPYAPPVGAKLFSYLEAGYPTWRSLSANAKSEFQRDGLFEPGFDYVREHHAELVTDLLIEMALYFCGFYSEGVSAYEALVRKIGKGDVLATTNYDFLCEIALERVHRSFSYLPKLADHPLLLKLHGSPNFIPHTPNIEIDAKFAGFSAHFDGPCRPQYPVEAEAYLRSRPALAPAISMYSKGKQVFYAPRQIEQIQVRFVEELAIADRIFIVGLGPSFHDEHIWQPLSRSPVELHYVNPDVQHISRVKNWAAQRHLRLTTHELFFVDFVSRYAR